MADDKPTLEQAFREIAALRALVTDQQRTITAMQRVGGFADSKALSLRSTRIEERLEKVELDGSMLKDFAGIAAEWIARHLLDRHAIAESDNGSDSIIARKVRRRLAEWAEKVGLLNKRRDVTGARNDENRLRPQAANS